MLLEGEQSGLADYSYEKFIAEASKSVNPNSAIEIT